MLLLLGWVWQQRVNWRNKRLISQLQIGMIFALLGDVFLMIREVDLFVPGLGAFLLMQLCYSAVFRQEVGTSKEGFTSGKAIGVRLALAGYAGIFIATLHGPFHKTPALEKLWVPVLGYVFALVIMAMLAALRRDVVPNRSYYTVLTGAVLFVLSDSVIAIDRFLESYAASPFIIMSTYAAAQYLIVTGVVSAHLTSVTKEPTTP